MCSQVRALIPYLSCELRNISDFSLYLILKAADFKQFTTLALSQCDLILQTDCESSISVSVVVSSTTQNERNLILDHRLR